MKAKQSAASSIHTSMTVSRTGHSRSWSFWSFRAEASAKIMLLGFRHCCASCLSSPIPDARERGLDVTLLILPASVSAFHALGSSGTPTSPTSRCLTDLHLQGLSGAVVTLWSSSTLQRTSRMSSQDTNGNCDHDDPRALSAVDIAKEESLACCLLITR